MLLTIGIISGIVLTLFLYSLVAREKTKEEQELEDQDQLRACEEYALKKLRKKRA